MNARLPEQHDQPTVREVRQHLPEICRRRSTVKGLVLFLSAVSFYALSQIGVVALPGWPAKAVCVWLSTLSLSCLYFVAHDACHGTLTRSTLLNRLIGRLAFWPCLHPYTTWIISHNRLHHGFTNLRGRDFVWAPLSKEEYDRLPPFRRWLERVYRSPAGVGLYALVEVWWKHLVFPGKARRGRKHLVCALDRLAVLAFPFVQAGLLWAGHRCLARAFPLPAFSVPALLAALVLPFLLLCWGAGLVTFLHHTHPKVRWYASRTEWSYFRGEVAGTVHVKLPWPLGAILHNVLEHTAHHADPRIPCYALADGQKRLEEAYPEIVVQEWTLREWLRTFAVCRLYDYANHRWLDFDGNVTS
jgi:omega-6 fatty acid desaturase (delta-12 desaturase)